MNAQIGPYLGSLCRRGHDHEGTGKSLRDSKGACIECERLMLQQRRERAQHRKANRQRLRDAAARACGDEPFRRAPSYNAEPEPAEPYHRLRTHDAQWTPREGALTLQECADRMGCSRERVRQIEEQALRKLRRRFGWLIEHLLPTHDPQARGVRR